MRVPPLLKFQWTLRKFEISGNRTRALAVPSKSSCDVLRYTIQSFETILERPPSDPWNVQVTKEKKKKWACQINYNHQPNKTESHPNGLHLRYPPILGKTWPGEAGWVITWFVWQTLPSINWEWQAAQCSGLASERELLQPSLHDQK